jgi:hypothetical protein
VPEGFDPTLQSVLTALPASVTKDDLLARLARSMPTLSVNPDKDSRGNRPRRT